jgi:acyl-CoA thioesterase 8
VHSYHCYFVLAGDSTIPILYHVERVREGRSFATRTVQARQRGKAIFTVTMSFVKDGSGGEVQVRHSAAMPTNVTPPPEDYVDVRPGGDTSPFQAFPIQINNRNAPPEEQTSRHWFRARGKISEAGGHQAHLSALAYVSDSDFIGSISRFHRLWRFPFKRDDWDTLPDHVKERCLKMLEFDGTGTPKDLRGDLAIGMMVSLDQ